MPIEKSKTNELNKEKLEGLENEGHQEESLEREIVETIQEFKEETQKKLDSIESNIALSDKTILLDIENETQIKEKLNEINQEVDELKEKTKSQLYSGRKSFFGNIESIEEKIKKVEELFNSLDTHELEREDIETHARGWNVTNNIQAIENFKQEIIREISSNSDKNTRSLGGIPCFEKLISQKEFQDITWISLGIDPDSLIMYDGNNIFNTFIQERPEFLESSEFKTVCLHRIKKGIKDGSLFEGYIHTKPEEFPETKIDFFKKNENEWSIRSSKDKENIFNENKNKKTKRKSLENEGKPYIINLDKYEYDISNIDSLDNEEKSEVKNLFIENISRFRTYNKYSSQKIFADEIFKIGFKLGVAEDEINQCTYNAMIKGITSGEPPANEITKEFSVVYQKIQETLTEPEKRKEVLNSLKENIKIEDNHFHKWKETLNYLNINNEEKEAVVNSYLDFSCGKNFPYKERDVFGYSFDSEEKFLFSKEKRLLAFSTMSAEQRASVIENYVGSIEKLDYLPFTNEDILEFGVNTINFVNPYDIKQAQMKIYENFPNIVIHDTDIAKRAIFKKFQSILDIQKCLEANSIEMSSSEIVSQFSSPEDFVLKQIEGADLSKLVSFEIFKNNPETPELPKLSAELYAEIKKNIKYSYLYDKSYLKQIVSFVPKEYNVSVLTDPDLQEVFSSYYAHALQENNQRFINDLRFLISKTEDLNNSEQKVFNRYFQENDYSNLIAYYKVLQKANTSSPTIQNLENLFKEKLTYYGVDDESIVLNSNNLDTMLYGVSLQKLEQLNPENLADEQMLQEWFSVKYKTGSKRALQVFNLVKNSKDFSYFDREIVNLLFKEYLSDKFIGMLQKNVESNPGSIDRTVEFIKDLDQFNVDFVKQNYDFLHKKLFAVSSEEYREKIDLLKKTKPLLGSRLVSNVSFEDLFNTVLSYNNEDREKFLGLIDTTTYGIDADNDLGWAKNTILYVNEVEEYGIFNRDQKRKDKMIELFSGDYKNIVLREMAGDWKKFLNSEGKVLPPEIYSVSKIIDGAGGAGNMKHIESLGNFIYQIQSTLDNKKTTDGTVQEIKEMLSLLEDRFSKEKWSQDTISEFYNLSKDILEASPSLYTALGPIFENISSVKDMKKFMSDVFPFYQTELVINQNINGDNTTYNPRDLVGIRSSIKEFANKLAQDQSEKSNLFEVEKLRLLEVARDGFKNRFGLLKVPENFTKENLRSIQNTIRYMGNISERTPERESLISLYLGLELNNKWSDFRGGKKIDINEYLSEKQLQLVTPLLEEKQKSYQLLSDISGIEMDRMPKLQEILQEDVFNNLIGDIQTIDVKLGNIKRNMDELVDPDIYQTQKEKDILDIFSTQSKNVNVVLSKIYAISSGKNLELSEEEATVKQKIESIFGINNWTPDKVKKIQDEIQPIGLVVNMVSKMEEERVEESITDLQNRLVPNSEIIEIFNKLGEEFHQESGALALSKDLSYLENIIIKDENKITAEEKEIVKEYIDSIHEKMKDLETVLDRVKQYFEKIKKSSHLENNSVLKSRIIEIEKVIYSQDTSSVITSQITKDLNLIIENMRQCLGCMRKEVNNDTNLSFGDYNKFFIMNQSEKEKGSISDEIVFFVPITTPNGTKEMSFVMDKVYGSKSPDVLFGNVSAVYKKYQAIKKEFPEAHLSISVANSTIGSVGLGYDTFEKKLRDLLGDKIEIEFSDELNASIPKSSLSDNYIEFGNVGARANGDRQFAGLVLR